MGKIKIVEVGPRDGLQNESQFVPTNVKVEFINRLSETGLTTIEATSFVSPQWIPQLADHQEVFSAIFKKPGVQYPVLVPNLSGLKNALSVDVKDIAVFTTPSEKFCRANLNCSVQDSLKVIKEIIEVAKSNHLRVRGYLSCVLGCPYQGEIEAKQVADLSEQLIQLGCDELSLGDTIGVGTSTKTDLLLKQVIKRIPVEKIAVHFHDTYGQALVNIFVALQNGITIIDSAVSGLGGCPYAKGASGNVATEEVVYLLHGAGYTTGIDLQKLIEAGQFLMAYLGRSSQSKVNQALSFKKKE